MSPIEIFSGAKLELPFLRNDKTWGCPAYGLGLKIQGGQKIPKRDPKTRRGEYLGNYPQHASSVGLIRKLCSGFIYPQYNILYDHFSDFYGRTIRKFWLHKLGMSRR